MKWKVKISGNAVSGQGREMKGFDFEVEGYMPHCSEMYLRSLCFAWYVPEWIKTAINKDGEKKYPSLTHLRRTDIEFQELVEGDYDIIGKDILKMNWEEVRDFATRFDIRATPYRNGSLKNVRKDLANYYLLKVLKLKLENFSEWKPNANGNGGELDIDKLKDVVVLSDKKIEEKITKKSLNDLLAERTKKAFKEKDNIIHDLETNTKTKDKTKEVEEIGSVAPKSLSDTLKEKQKESKESKKSKDSEKPIPPIQVGKPKEKSNSKVKKDKPKTRVIE